MTLVQFPSLILGATVVAYWGCVLVMVIRVGRRTRRVSRILIPAQRREQLMWLLWVPLIFAWMTLPLLAALRVPRGNPWLEPAEFATSPLLLVARFGAVLCAIGCLAASIWSWRHMGRHWRMGVDPAQEGELFVDGPFAYVRHPIYAASVLLMICSVVALPTPLIALLAVVHIGLMNVKARNEERHLRDRFGPSYDEYCARTGRFFPARSCRRGDPAARDRTPQGSRA